LKSEYLGPVALVALFCLSACHHGPTATSADGDTLSSGQELFAKRAALACYSADELKQVIDFKAKHDGDGLFQYLHGGHCGTFETPERVKILRIEPGDGYQVAVVTDLDDKTAPAELWIDSKQLSVSK
jgi:hypothetical protein